MLHLEQRQERLLLAVDDKEARAVASAMRLEYVGTAGILLEACARGHLSIEDLEDAVTELARVMWLSPDVVAAILRRARGMKQ